MFQIQTLKHEIHWVPLHEKFLPLPRFFDEFLLAEVNPYSSYANLTLGSRVFVSFERFLLFLLLAADGGSKWSKCAEMVTLHH